MTNFKPNFLRYKFFKIFQFDIWHFFNKKKNTIISTVVKKKEVMIRKANVSLRTATTTHD